MEPKYLENFSDHFAATAGQQDCSTKLNFEPNTPDGRVVKKKKSRSGSRKNNNRKSMGSRAISRTKENSPAEVARSPKISNCAFWSHKNGNNRGVLIQSKWEKTKSREKVLHKKRKQNTISEMQRAVDKAKKECSNFSLELGKKEVQL